MLFPICLTLFVLGGGAESTRWPEKCVFRPVVDKKSEMKGRKNPSPRPLTPPNTLGFFLYTRTTLKLLVEHQNRVFSCSVFICVNERTKCAKNPNINRVKFHHDLVLTLFVLGGAESTPWPEKCVFRPVVDEKSEIKGQKNPSPRPLTPPNTLGFFLYTRITLKMLVEHQNKGFHVVASFA